ncbi:MAG: hypothetical protein IPM49_17690 [Flavobacteriales bacterium]|nr:hypothetical protein [Flavobacteriales bacterium]HMQ76017.1 hypothetical protein [Flavobacteriales bacterium]HMR27583.1 hypothetical protein [Flavobacteriales bacterium]
MAWSDRTVGLVSGLLAPAVGFLAYGLIYVNVIRPHNDLGWFVHDLFLGTRRYQAPVLSLSLLADVPLFFWFDRTGRVEAMRGVLMALFIHGAVIVALWI